MRTVCIFDWCAGIANFVALCAAGYLFIYFFAKDSGGQTPPPVRVLTLTFVRLFTASNLYGGSNGPLSPAVRPLMVLGLRRKYERVARNERKPMVSNFMVLDQPVTSEVRSNTQI